MPDTSEMMKPEPDLFHLEELIKETLEVSKENNKMLKRIRRDAIIGGIAKFVFWLVVIVASFYYSLKLIEPYLSAFQDTQNGQGSDYQSLINQYKDLLGK